MKKSLAHRLSRIWDDVKLLMQPVVVISGLGYMVDVFDMATFSVVRTPSLKDLGLEGDALTEAGMFIMNMQMAGLIIGGIVWGMLGDKLGRLKVLFASIVMYSVANIGSGFSTGVNDYAVWRFMAGFGLAGEVGAAVTIVSESLPKTKRGLGVMLIVAGAAIGAILAGIVGQILPWRVMYFVGGIAGLLLLLARMSLKESKVFTRLTEHKKIERGNLMMILTSPRLLMRYVRCVCVGLPVWYVIGILVTLSPEFARDMGVKGEVTAAMAITLCYSALFIGDFACGFLGQILQSRRKALLLCLACGLPFFVLYFALQGVSSTMFYAFIFAVGLLGGYWVTFVTSTAEQFGTNLRATVTTSVPNFVRGSVIPMNMLLAWMHGPLGLSFHISGLILGVGVVWIAFTALLFTPETFHRDLEFVEER
ncbi:MAG: MFS transporter [Alphaproteobacteria bacterium]|nr:MFS transporter [Alphaproteobacteria bacterium]